MKHLPSSLVMLPLCAALTLTAATAWAQATDPVVLSFSTVGDSRQDPAKVDPTQKPLTQQDYQWLQNSKAWSRLMREISAKKPSMLFFNGDMIMGYGNADPAGVNNASVAGVVNSDLVRYYTQSAFWRGMVAPLIEAGTYVVPVPGNHEVQCRSGKVTTKASDNIVASVNSTTGDYTWANVSCKDVNGATATGKLGMKTNEDAWRANYGDLIIDTGRLNATLPTGLAASNVNVSNHAAADGLATDQSQLSYSFDVGNNHFAIVNTDPAGADATAPTNWLSADFSAAQARGAQHFFVFGHKPAYTYLYPGASLGGLDAGTSTANRDAFWSLIETYGATYFCGHEHTFNMAQPAIKQADGTTRTSTAWQVLVGSGGSPFDMTSIATGEPQTDRYYAYANVRVYQSGKVQIDAYGFSDQYGPSKLLQTITLAH